MSDFDAPYNNGQGGPYYVPFEGIGKKIQRFYMGNGAAGLTLAASFIGLAFLLHLLFSKVYGYILNTNVLFNHLYFSSHMAKLCLEMCYTLLCVGLPFMLVYLIMRRTRFVMPEISCGRVRKNSCTFLLILGGMAMCFAGNILTSILVTVFSGAGIDFASYEQAASQSVPLPQNILQLGLMVLHMAVFPAVFEEFAFRGVVLQSLRKYGDWFAILVSAVFFGLVHGNMTQMPFAMIAGVALGYIVTVTGSLWLGVLLHFINNFISLIVTFVRVAFSVQTAILFSNLMVYGFIFIGALAFGAYVYLKPSFYRLYPTTEKRISKKRATALLIFNPPVALATIIMFIPVFEDMIFSR